MTKIHTLVKGSISRSTVLLIRMAMMFVLMPFTLKSLGDELYGLWALASSLTSYYFLLDFGVSQAVSRYVARLIGQKKVQETGTLLSNSIFAYVILSAISLILSICLLFILGGIVPADILPLARVTIAIIAIDFCITLPLKTFQGVLVANMDYVALSAYEITQISIRSVIIFIMLSLGYGIIALALVNLITDVLFHYTLLFHVVAKYRYRISFHKVSWIKARELFSFGSSVFLTQIGDLLRFRIGSFIAAASIGLSGVTIFSIATKIIDYFMQLVFSIVSVVNPLFSRYEGAKDFDSIRDKFILGVRLSSLLSVFGLANILMFGKSFITVWMGRQYLAAYPVLVVLAIPVTIDLSQTVIVGVLRSINRHRIYALMNLAEGVLILVFSLVLTPKYGLMGTAIGTAIPMILNNLIVEPVITCRLINLKLSTYIRSIYPVIMASAAFLALFSILISTYVSDSYSLLAIALLVMIEAGFYSVFSIFVILNKKEKIYVQQYASRIPGIYRFRKWILPEYQ